MSEINGQITEQVECSENLRLNPEKNGGIDKELDNRMGKPRRILN